MRRVVLAASIGMAMAMAVWVTWPPQTKDTTVARVQTVGNRDGQVTPTLPLIPAAPLTTAALTLQESESIELDGRRFLRGAATGILEVGTWRPPQEGPLWTQSEGPTSAATRKERNELLTQIRANGARAGAVAIWVGVQAFRYDGSASGKVEPEELAAIALFELEIVTWLHLGSDSWADVEKFQQRSASWCEEGARAADDLVRKRGVACLAITPPPR